MKSQLAELNGNNKKLNEVAATQSAHIRTEAAEAGKSAAAQTKDAITRLATAHEVEMTNLGEERAKVKREHDEAVNARETKLRDPLEIQREIQEIPGARAKIALQASTLQTQAEAEQTETYPGRMAQFLGFFMPDSSQAERIAAALAIFVPLLSLIISIAPPTILEVVLHSLIVNREKELPKKKRSILRRFFLGNRALRRERGLVAARGRILQEREGQLPAEIERVAAERCATLQRENDAARAALDGSAKLMAEVLESHRNKHSETMELFAKQRADIENLASTIMRFDARGRDDE